jgi:hypothetical protein
VYAVEDEHFLYELDDRYLRLLRILMRLDVLLASDQWCENATEVNEIKFLFRSAQSWSRPEARLFVTAALNRLSV